MTPRVMKSTKVFATICLTAVMLAFCACSQASYSHDTCLNLSEKIERGESLSQKDYSSMIAQSKAILEYLIDRTDQLSEISGTDERESAARELHADPEFMDRFGYLFTFSSCLYRAELAGNLDSGNLRDYQDLSEYNDRFAAMTDGL